MTLLHPILGVLGVLAVSIPIVLHLLRRKRRPVAWGAMRFILEAQKRTRRRFTIEEILLLIARCLLIALAGLAIARPMIAGEGALGGSQPKTLALILDNSLTSGVRAGEGTELDRSIEEALRLLDGLDPASGDRASLVLASGPPEAIIAEPTSDLEAVRRELRRVTPASSRADLPAAAALAGQSLSADQDREDRLVVALLSAFRAGSADPGRAFETLGADRIIALPPASERAANITAEQIAPLRRVAVAGDPSGGGVEITLRRSGTDDSSLETEAEIGLFSPGAAPITLATSTLRFEPGRQTTAATVPIAIPDDAPDDSALVVTLAPDAIAGDDKALWPLDVRDRLRVGIVANPAPAGPGSIADYTPDAWLAIALAPDPDTAASIDTRRIAARGVNTPQLAGLDAVFVANPASIDPPGWQALASFASSGGLLVLMPEPGEAPQLWTDSAIEQLGLPWSISRGPITPSEPLTLRAGESSTLLGSVAGEISGLLDPVSVNRYLTIDPRGVGIAPLALSSGEPFVLVASPARAEPEPVSAASGKVVLLASPPELSWTDLPAKPLMIPLVQELLREGIAEAGRSPVRTAGRPLAPPPGTIEAEPIERDTPALSADATPIHAGLYRLLRAGAQPAGLIAVNPDPEAADTTPTPRDTLEPWIESLASASGRVRWVGDEADRQSTAEAGTPLAPTLLAIALAMALVELFFAWRISAGGMSGGGS